MCHWSWAAARCRGHLCSQDPWAYWPTQCCKPLWPGLVFLSGPQNLLFPTFPVPCSPLGPHFLQGSPCIFLASLLHRPRSPSAVTVTNSLSPLSTQDQWKQILPNHTQLSPSAGHRAGNVPAGLGAPSVRRRRQQQHPRCPTSPGPPSSFQRDQHGPLFPQRGARTGMTHGTESTGTLAPHAAQLPASGPHTLTFRMLWGHHLCRLKLSAPDRQAAPAVHDPHGLMAATLHSRRSKAHPHQVPAHRPLPHPALPPAPADNIFHRFKPPLCSQARSLQAEPGWGAVQT